MSDIAIRIVVHGRVQGVGFRYFVFGEASRRSIRGYVRNKADGSVEIVACGESRTVGEFRTCVQSGPIHSIVEKFDVTPMPVSENYESFKII